MKLLTSILLVAILLLGGCAAEGPKLSTPTPSPTVTLGNTSNLVENQDQVIYGKIYPGEEKTYEVLVGNVTQVSFELKWIAHQLGLSLTTPTGKPYGICGYGAGPCGGTRSDCIILNPEPGKWTVHVSALDVPQSGKDYLLLVSFNKTEINLYLDMYPTMYPTWIYQPGEPIRITMGPRLSLGGPGHEGITEVITGASVVADIVTPSNMTESLALYDDGKHNDGQADDGTYSNVFTDTSSQGIYGISVTASGTANDVKFQKRDATLVWVSLPPDLSIDASDIVFSDDNPHDGDSISITATIHNTGEGDALNANIWFYYDQRWSGDIAIPFVDIPTGGTVEVKAWWVARAGDHNIYVDAINQCGIDEQNLSNNQAFRPIHVSVEINQ